MPKVRGRKRSKKSLHRFAERLRRLDRLALRPLPIFARRRLDVEKNSTSAERRRRRDVAPAIADEE